MDVFLSDFSQQLLYLGLCFRTQLPGVQTTGIVQNRRANSEIEQHILRLQQCRSLVPHLLSKLNVTARYWIVLRKENRGGGVGGVGGGGFMRD